MDQSEASIYYLAIVTHDAQSTDGVVQSPEAVIVVKYLQDASEGEGQAKEHDAVLATCLMGALQQPEAIPHQLRQCVVREAERRNEDISFSKVEGIFNLLPAYFLHGVVITGEVVQTQGRPSGCQRGSGKK